MKFNKKVEENYKARCTEGSAGDKSHAVPGVARVLWGRCPQLRHTSRDLVWGESGRGGGVEGSQPTLHSPKIAPGEYEWLRFEGRQVKGEGHLESDKFDRFS